MPITVTPVRMATVVPAIERGVAFVVQVWVARAATSIAPVPTESDTGEAAVRLTTYVEAPDTPVGAVVDEERGGAELGGELRGPLRLLLEGDAELLVVGEHFGLVGRRPGRLV